MSDNNKDGAADSIPLVRYVDFIFQVLQFRPIISTPFIMVFSAKYTLCERSWTRSLEFSNTTISKSTGGCHAMNFLFLEVGERWHGTLSLNGGGPILGEWMMELLLLRGWRMENSPGRFHRMPHVSHPGSLLSPQAHRAWFAGIHSYHMRAAKW